jgi:GNAT superfamily N-acetyltransferase
MDDSFVAGAAAAGVAGLAAWAAAQEADGCAAAAADGAARGRDAAAPATPSAAAAPLFAAGADAVARALRWAAAFTNAREGPLGGGLRLRVATAHPSDVAAMHGFVVDLAVFEREPDAVLTTPATFLRDGFGPARQYYCVFVEAPRAGGAAAAAAGAAPWADHKPVAMALAHRGYSTWQGPAVFVEDVYVAPAHRRGGVGERLFLCWARAARAAGCVRLQWSALDWNAGAIALYRERLRAETLSEWTLFRLYADGIARVADGGAAGAAAASS